MALDFEQTKEIEVLKQKHKLELGLLQVKQLQADHDAKMVRLEKLLEIAKADAKNAPFKDRGDY